MKNVIIKIVCLFFLTFTVNSFCQSITWERLYNPPGNQSDGFRSICQADGNNIYMAGYTFLTSNLATRRIYILKINPFGDTLWTRIIGNDSIRPVALAITSSGDGGCVFTGNWNEAFTIKINSVGEILWQKFYGGVGIQLFDIKKTTDGGFIACGRDDNANFDGIIVKIDSLGNLQWQRTYTALFYKVFSSIEIAHDSGYILVGRTSNFSQEYPKGFITKINSNGDTLWNRLFVIDTITSADKIVRINNGYLIGGNVNHVISFNYSTFYFVKVNSNGDSISAKLFNTPKANFIYDIKAINNNKYIFAGWEDSTTANILNGKITITDSAGNLLRQKILPSPDYIVLYSILPQSNGDLVIAGEADMNINPFNDAYAVRLDSNLNYNPIGIENISSNIPEQVNLYQNYPNPFNPKTNIEYQLPKNSIVKIVVYDVLGREVVTLVNQQQSAGTYRVDFDATAYPSGIYFYTLTVRQAGSTTGEYRKTNKMVLLK